MENFERSVMKLSIVFQVRRQRNPIGPPISPRELKVVTDTMLQGLGRHLRCCGVDVKMLINTDDHDKAAEVMYKL